MSLLPLFVLQTLHLYLRGSKGDVFINTPHLVQTALSIVNLSVPRNWYELLGNTSPPHDQWDLKEWLADIVMRFAFIDRVISWGLEKTSTYWLGALFNPQSLLSIFHQVLLMINILPGLCNAHCFVFRIQLCHIWVMKELYS